MTKKFLFEGRNGQHRPIALYIIVLVVIAMSTVIMSCAGHVQIKRISEINMDPVKHSTMHFSEGDTYFTISDGTRTKVDEFYIPNLDWEKKRFVLNIFAIGWDEIPTSWAEEIVHEFLQKFEQIAEIKIEFEKGETAVGTLPTTKDKKWKFPYGINMNSIQYQYDQKGKTIEGKRIINSNITDLKDIVEVQVYLPAFRFDQEENNKVITYLVNVVFLDTEPYFYKTEKYLYKIAGIPILLGTHIVLPMYYPYGGNDPENRNVPGLKNILTDDLNIPQREVDKLISELRNKIAKSAEDREFTRTSPTTGEKEVIGFRDHPEREEMIDFDGSFNGIRLGFYTGLLSKRLVDSRDSYLLNIPAWTKLITEVQTVDYATLEPIPLLRSIYYGDASEAGLMFITREKFKEKFKETGYGGYHFAPTTKFPNWAFKGYGNSVAVLGKIHNIDEIDLNRAIGVDDAFKLLAEKYKERRDWVRIKVSDLTAEPVHLSTSKYNIDPGVAIRNFETSRGRRIGGVLGWAW